MEKRLREVLNILEKLNSNTDIVTKEDIDEQHENMDDFGDLTDELDQLLSSFNTVNLNDGNKVEELLFEIHRIMTTFEWNFSEISELNRKLLKGYKDKIKNQ
ncbi:hypothetical protein EHV15_02025 [Paenibacillus oralis]|uniref:Uncharacterized protein n=1 Tax=Paenibacillus oralis TaxID=2490856 RepID=A0A3P3TWZ1_9BACL|nr:hypothetical protein [Paenibacillus oralis]RRJ61889.1 hypothetical protein EHV15_02025 [Paenibacillus oralis]